MRRLPVFSDKALADRPWLWKFDARRPRGCAHNGHRYRWFRSSERVVYAYHGFCKRCAHHTYFEVERRGHKPVRVISEVPVVEVTLDQARELVAYYAKIVKLKTAHLAKTLNEPRETT